MPKFTGQLNVNSVFSAIFNMIISQTVFADNIKGTASSLVDRARVDGTLYGDTKLYYSTDVLKSADWGADLEAANLLKLYRPKAPEVQKIELNTFRQICLSLDSYLTKQAFSTREAFSEFNSVMLGWIRETKRVYDSTIYNTFIGTNETTIGKQQMEVDVTTATAGLTGEEKARVKAGVYGESMAKLVSRLKDISRDYNDYGYLRSYNMDDLLFIWNEDKLAEIEKRDLPTIFHKDFIENLGKDSLPARYFGKVNDKTVTKSNGTTIRSLIEQDVTDSSDNTYHLFAGDIIPANVTLASSSEIIYPSYTEDNTILYKVIEKRSVPYMSAFQVATDFFNPKSLTETHYLTFGHNTLEALKNFPFITVREK